MTGRVRARGRLTRTVSAVAGSLLWLLPLVPAIARATPFTPGRAVGSILLGLLLLAFLLRPFGPQARRRYATAGLRGLGRGWPWALLAALAFVAFSLAAAALNSLVSAPPPGQVPYAYADRPLGWLVLPLEVGVAAPLIEEFWLRGQLLPRLGRIWGAPIALVAVSAIFALMHGSPGMLPAFFAGALLLGYARLATRSIWAPILAHALANWWAIAVMEGWLTDLTGAGVPLLVGITLVSASATVLLLWQSGRARQRRRSARAAGARATRVSGPDTCPVQAVAVEAVTRRGGGDVQPSWYSRS